MKGGHGTGRDRVLGVELGPQGGRGGVWGGEHVRDIRQAADAGQGGQLSDPSWSAVLDPVVGLGGGSAAYAHVDRGTASQGATECVAVVQVALDVLQT